MKGFLLKGHKTCDIGILQIPDGQSQRRHGTNAQLLPCKRGSSPGTARTTLLKTFGEFKKTWKWELRFYVKVHSPVLPLQHLEDHLVQGQLKGPRQFNLMNRMKANFFYELDLQDRVPMNTWTLSRTVLSVMAAAHWSLRISKQIAPVTLETLGCHIFVMNRTWLYRVKTTTEECHLRGVEGVRVGNLDLKFELSPRIRGVGWSCHRACQFREIICHLVEKIGFNILMQIYIFEGSKLTSSNWTPLSAISLLLTTSLSKGFDHVSECQLAFKALKSHLNSLWILCCAILAMLSAAGMQG